VFWTLPCVGAFALGWVIWSRWLAQAATLLLCAFVLWPFSVDAILGGGYEATVGFWLRFVGLCCLMLSLTELAIRVRDRYQAYLSRRFRGFDNSP